MPVFNEVENLIARAQDIAAQSPPWEWIVVDGGSTDGSHETARNLGALVIDAPLGRGTQLAAGAQRASGDFFLFLHADTHLAVEALDKIRAACSQIDIVGGNFALRFDDEGRIARMFEWFYAAQRRMLGWYFGDSAIFVRRSVYLRCGGFAAVPIMEDHLFAQALERAGTTVCLPLPVTTSARRYRKRPLYMLFRWMTIMTLFQCGVSPHRLAQLYRPHGRDR